MPSLVRIAAAVVALIGWFGLAVQFNATLASSSFGGTVWILLRFFTIWTNIVVAVVMTGTAFGSPRFGSPRVLGFATLSILLVGVVYHLLLRGLLELSGGHMLANMILHQVVPVLMALFWLILAPKGRLKRIDPLLWASFPLIYVVYAIPRGA